MGLPRITYSSGRGLVGVKRTTGLPRQNLARGSKLRFKARKPLPRGKMRPTSKGLKSGRTTKPRKDSVWSLRKADEVFSEQIRKRDGRCMHPMGNEYCKSLQNSHYIGRVTKSTRYDPDNCITLCWFHHYKSKDLGFEYQKQQKENPKHGFDGQYTIFMKKLLGKERFAALNERAKVSIKQNAAIKSFQQNYQSSPLQ